MLAGQSDTSVRRGLSRDRPRGTGHRSAAAGADAWHGRHCARRAARSAGSGM